MAKKIILAVFGGIAAMGLLVAVVGFCMGGRPGTFRGYDGQLVYSTIDGQRLAVAGAPGWMQRGWWFNWGKAPEAPSAPAAPHAPSSPSASARPDASTAAGTSVSGNYAAAPFGAGQLQKLELDIAAGYVVVRAGEEIGLEVDGPLEYTSEFENGTWTVKTVNEHHLFNNWGNRFWRGDTDITTTFTLTLPAEFDQLDLQLDMGEASVTGLTLRELDCQTDMGSITVKNTAAAEAEFSVNMGGITVSGFEGDDCALSCAMGSIEFEGLARTQLEADCDLGSIVATLPAPASYSGKAKVSLGGVTVGGQSRGDGSFSGTNAGGEAYTPYLELKCGLGSIEVKFD